ncbi:hypothetical protein GCM10017673_38190 [Streptosporangium violaceochromogenes]|nr:hypothetical protein GCM10017673_38190 [Streptosporangium violaceochromogenes]
MGYKRDLNRHYYEFRTVGRELSGDEMKIMRLFNAWTTVTASRLVYDSEYGDEFQLNADALLTAYFDMAAIFVQGGGRRSIAFRLPLDLRQAVKPYVGQGMYGAVSWVSEENLFVKLERNDPDTQYSDEEKPQKWIDEFLPLRDMMRAGDLSPLYAAWEMDTCGSYPSPPGPADLDGLEEVGDWSPPRLALDKWLWLDYILNTEKDRAPWMRPPGGQ